MPRAPKQPRAKATVDSLVEAGFICVARHGIGGTTTRHVADVAGLGVGSFYEYFTDKEDLFAAMTARFAADLAAELRPLLPTVVRLEIAPAIRTILETAAVFLSAHDKRYLLFVRGALADERKLPLEPVTQLMTEFAVQYIFHHPELTRLSNVPAITYILIHGGTALFLGHLSEVTPPVSFEELVHTLSNVASAYVAHELQARSELDRREARAREPGRARRASPSAPGSGGGSKTHPRAPKSPRAR